MLEIAIVIIGVMAWYDLVPWEVFQVLAAAWFVGLTVYWMGLHSFVTGIKKEKEKTRVRKIMGELITEYNVKRNQDLSSLEKGNDKGGKGNDRRL